MSCSVGRRRSSDQALLWLCCRQAAVTPIQPLAWELPYVAGVAPKRQKKKKKGVMGTVKSAKLEQDLAGAHSPALEKYAMSPCADRRY